MPQGTKHLTTEQVEQIRELHQAGRSTRQTMEVVGCSEHQVRHALKRLGLKPAWSRNGMCYQHADQVREWAKQGLSLAEIARRIGTNHSIVSAYLAKHGMERTPFRQVGENNPAWKGGRMLDKQGYVLLHMPDHPGANRHGYVREHRWVMEQVLGRFLTPDEVVHHKDGVPGNNDPSNLELFASNADHLAQTRKGLQPKWSAEGFRRIQERWSRLPDDQRTSIHYRDRGPDGRLLPKTNDPTSE
jgi:hypothetical protein